MTSSYSVGSVLALVEKYNLTNPDIVIGASGSAGTLAYYVSGQYDSIKNIWENLLSTKDFIDPKRLGRIMDIDYLIDQVFKVQDPLLVEKVFKSPINFLIPYTNIATGIVEYFWNRDRGDLFNALRATKAMPFIFGKSVDINGQFYCDTLLSAYPAGLIEKAKSLGADKILVLDNSKPNAIMKNGAALWVSSSSKKFRDNYSVEIKRLDKTHFEGPVFYLEPLKPLKVSALTSDQSLLKDAVETGYNDAINNENLQDFLDL